MAKFTIGTQKADVLIGKPNGPQFDIGTQEIGTIIETEGDVVNLHGDPGFASSEANHATQDPETAPTSRHQEETAPHVGSVIFNADRVIQHPPQ